MEPEGGETGLLALVLYFFFLGLSFLTRKMRILTSASICLVTSCSSLNLYDSTLRIGTIRHRISNDFLEEITTILRLFPQTVECKW